VLGQGQRCTLDPRFASPDSTLRLFWEALRAGDAETASMCIEDGGYTGPYPGMVWFLPPASQLRLESIRSLPVQRDRVMVSYIVHCYPSATSEELSFQTENQLVRVRGEWRICSPVGSVSLPGWNPEYRKFLI